jgi:alpha-L-fucosidase
MIGRVAGLFILSLLLPDAVAEEPLQWFREARFGLFIHWGPVSLKGTEIGWSRGGERRGRSGTGAIPVEEYDNLYRSFDPEKFDARQWARIARSAGMQYLVFTTKHHDGFCMFDSALTEYKITNTPFKRDIVRELAEACRAEGLRLGWYYSQPDWHHPYYRTERHADYVNYLHGQVEEILTQYGKVDVLWFDGLGGKPTDWDAEALFMKIRKWQPGILINNRAGIPGDFDTPEQRIGTFQNDRAWESCITICRQWAWKPGDTMKSLEECIHTLVRCAGGDGNLLLNVGPMPTGEIEPRQVERLKEIGAWLKRYGESIYGTRGGPFKPGDYGASTYKGDTIFLHVLQGARKLALPAVDKKIISMGVLGGGKAKFEQSEDGIQLELLKPDPIDTVIELKLDGPAAEIVPTAVPSGSLAFGKAARASNIFKNLPEHAAGKAFDDDSRTRWATDAGTRQAWLEVDLGTPTLVGSAMIDEAYEGRVQKFALEAETSKGWKTVFEGTTLGRRFVAEFKPVNARRFRLKILEASEGPTIRELRLFP